MACMELTNASAVVQECQRYFDRTAFGYVGTVASTCPPVNDECLDSGMEGYFWCSNQLSNAVIKCPGGMSSAAFCSSSESCTYESMLSTSEYTRAEAATIMCSDYETMPPTPAAYASSAYASDDFCYDYGWCVTARIGWAGGRWKWSLHAIF